MTSGLSEPVSSVTKPRGSASSRSKTACATSSKSAPCATGSPPASPRKLPLLIATPFSCASFDAIVTAPVATDASASSIASAFASASFALSNATSAARPAGIESVRMTCTSFVARSAACSAARMTFELLGSTKTEGAFVRSMAATRSAADGFIDCPPSTICVAPELSNNARLPAPATTATTSLSADGASAHDVEKALLALLGLLVHVRDLDLLERADGGPERERRARIVRVHVHLDRGRVADHEQRVAERLELRLRALRGPVPRPRRRRRCSSGTSTAPGAPPRHSALPRAAPPGSARPRARRRCRARSPAGRRLPHRRHRRCAGRRAARACARRRRRHEARPRRAVRAQSRRRAPPPPRPSRG